MSHDPAPIPRNTVACDDHASPALLGGLSAVVASWCLVLLAGWLPHYLTRPWHVDSDHFAMLAQLWDSAGKVPYRDVFTMQFPGEIYLYWALGKLTGWGNTVAFNAVDAGMVVSLCLLMTAWSRRQFRTALPGLIGASAFLTYYLDKDYTFTGQRDWHAAFEAMVGLIVLLGWSGRAARLVSAFAYALAVVTRPHFALLAPAMLIAAYHQPRTDVAPSRRGLRGLVEWGCFGIAALVLGFVPLIATGAFDDFLRCLRSITYGSGYNRVSPTTVVFRMFSQASGRLSGVTVPASILLLLLSSRVDARYRGAAWALLAAMAGLFLYAPVSPLFLPYSQFPFESVFAVATCLLAGLIVATGSRSIVHVTALLLLFGLVGLKKPEFVTFKGHYEDRVVQYHGKAYILKRKEYGIREAIGFLKSGELPVGNPPGFRDTLRPYPWDDLRGVIVYLRAHTTKETPVANLTLDCAAAITGVVPRLSPLPADSFGLPIFPELLLEPDLRALRDSENCVVVWNPASAEAEFPGLAPIWESIRAHYRPEAKFGDLEIWRQGPRASGESKEK